MSTGWRYIRDDGEEYKSALMAAQSLLDRPESTFEFSELSMAGVKRRDATDEIKQLLLVRGLRSA